WQHHAEDVQPVLSTAKPALVSKADTDVGVYFAKPRKRPATSKMNSFLKVLVAAALHGAAVAQQVSQEQIKGLDEQVQDIKKDVLAISSELTLLEEKLL